MDFTRLSQKSKSFTFHAGGDWVIQKNPLLQPLNHPYLSVRLYSRGCRGEVKLSFGRKSECCDEGDVL